MSEEAERGVGERGCTSEEGVGEDARGAVVISGTGIEGEIVGDGTMGGLERLILGALNCFSMSAFALSSRSTCVKRQI